MVIIIVSKLKINLTRREKNNEFKMEDFTYKIIAKCDACD